MLKTDAQEIVWKRRIEPVDFSVLQKLKERADVFTQRRERTWFVLFSKSGFSEALRKEAAKSEEVILVEVRDIICRAGLTIFGGIMGVALSIVNQPTYETKASMIVTLFLL